MEKCQRCEETDEDRRTLWMSCFYDMNELGLPFKQEELISSVNHGDRLELGRSFYTLTVCKRCRADWMLAIKDWFNEAPPDNNNPSATIFIRELGATKGITREEWEIHEIY